MAERASATRTVYHVVQGEVSMYNVDARHALTFDEWRDKPWTDAQAEAWKKKQARAKDAGTSEAKADAE